MPAFITVATDFLVANALWLAINIAVPVLLPYLVILLIAIDQISSAPGAGTTTWRTLAKKSVDTGQLFWTAISMLAATAYAAISGWEKHVDLHVQIGWILGLCMFIGIICTVLVGLCTLRAATGGTTNWTVIILSIFITLALCFWYPIVHFQLT